MQEIIEKFKNHSNGVRVVMLIHRNKEGGKNNKFKRHLRKVITTNSEEFFETIKNLKEIKDNDERTLRIYATCNSRDMNKAIRVFKEKELANDYEQDKFKFYIDIKNRFISSLMSPKCRAEKNFMFDLDDCDERSFHQIYNQLEKLTKILNYYVTKNGYHIITKPFNYPKQLEPEIIESIHTDSLMLIDY